MRDVNPDTITGTLPWYKIATQWIQSYPCKTKSSHETEKSLSTLLDTSHRPKRNNTNNSMEFGRGCEDLSWNRRISILYRSETNGTAERAVRRVKEGTSAVLQQSGLDEKMVGRFHDMLLLSAKRPKLSWPTGRRHVKDDLDNHSKGQQYFFGESFLV